MSYPDDDDHDTHEDYLDRQEEHERRGDLTIPELLAIDPDDVRLWTSEDGMIRWVEAAALLPQFHRALAESQAEVARLELAASEGRRVAEIANAHGWSGTESSKILSVHIESQLDELARLRQDVRELAAESALLRIQLAGCGVAAAGGTSGPVVANEGEYGWSPSYQSVLDLRIERDALAKRVADLDVLLRRSLGEMGEMGPGSEGKFRSAEEMVDRMMARWRNAPEPTAASIPCGCPLCAQDVPDALSGPHAPIRTGEQIEEVVGCRAPTHIYYHSKGEKCPYGCSECAKDKR